jgi:hypothetical protein
MARKKKEVEAESEELKGYESHAWVLQKLEEAQNADHDNREQAREAVLFVNQRGGQWEQQWWNRADGKPRYTFDLVTPILDQVQKTMDRADFSISVLPSGGAASKENAAIYDGLVRNIENISNAQEIFGRAGRSMVLKGIDGWSINQRYIDGDSFDQDLVIEAVPNWIDTVWLGPHTEPDGSDCEYAFRLTGLTPDEFKEDYPERAESASLPTDRTTTSYYYRQDLVMVGQFFYKKEAERTLVLMTSGKVYEDNEDFQAMKDELAALGVTEMARRKREKYCVYTRKFDMNGWIGEAKKTAFENWIPLVPCYGNFDIVEDGKIIYYGAVEKLMDPQRVYNYTLSREIEEGALAPRAKYWMTPKQAAGFEEALSTMNINADPVQFFNPDGELPGPPQQNGGAQINPGLSRISEAMQNLVGMTAGMFAANMGDNPGLQSGVAIEALQDRGDAGSNKYILARTIAQRQTGRILVDTIPRVYLPSRQVRILQEDGSYDMETIGEEVIDTQTGRKVVLNDLSEGTYDVTCTTGPSFQNRQSQTVTALTEVGAIDPSVIQLGGDILLRNINAPGMEQLAARKRNELFKAGLIPEDQMTDEEKQQLQAQQQQPQQPDAMTIAAMAEDKKAQALMLDSETKQIDAMASAQESQTNSELKRQELQIKAFEAETERYKVDIMKAEAISKIQGNEAKAEKDLADADAKKMSSALSVATALDGPNITEQYRPNGQA